MDNILSIQRMLHVGQETYKKASVIQQDIAEYCLEIYCCWRHFLWIQNCWLIVGIYQFQENPNHQVL